MVDFDAINIIAGTNGCGVVDSCLSTAVKLDSLLFNTNGTTNVLDIDDAKVYYTGGSVLFDTNYVSPFPATAGADDYPARKFGQVIAVPGTNLDFINGATSCIYLEYDTTYFWLAYDVKATATQSNFLDADLRGASVGGTAGTCPSPGGSSTTVVPDAGGFSLTGASQIDLPYCVGTYNRYILAQWILLPIMTLYPIAILTWSSSIGYHTNIGASNK
ncbi:MAG: hypothetical protein IPP46_06095 [Bacteroidetes bacterium]|nr:hypothetical protein [Bacteroidota bacterium]